MLTCPNINTKEWKDLVSLIGEKGAFKEYIKKGTGEIPSIKDVKPLSDILYGRKSSEEAFYHAKNLILQLEKVHGK